MAVFQKESERGIDTQLAKYLKVAEKFAECTSCFKEYIKKHMEAHTATKVFLQKYAFRVELNDPRRTLSPERRELSIPGPQNCPTSIPVAKQLPENVLIVNY